MQEHWLSASFKMELRKMLHGELLHPQWSCKLAGQEAGQCIEEAAGSAVGSRALMGCAERCSVGERRN